jgi:hypothetical protein
MDQDPYPNMQIIFRILADLDPRHWLQSYLNKCQIRIHNTYSFFFVVFGGPKALLFHSPLPPLRGQPTVKYHPRWQPI